MAVRCSGDLRILRKRGYRFHNGCPCKCQRGSLRGDRRCRSRDQRLVPDDGSSILLPCIQPVKLLFTVITTILPSSFYLEEFSFNKKDIPIPANFYKLLVLDKIIFFCISRHADHLVFPFIGKIIDLCFKFCLIFIRKSFIFVNNIKQTSACCHKPFKSRV